MKKMDKKLINLQKWFLLKIFKKTVIKDTVIIFNLHYMILRMFRDWIHMQFS